MPSGPATLEDAIDRYRRLLAAREEGRSYEEIGAREAPPLTKQRVASILRHGEPVRRGGRPKSGSKEKS